MPQMKARMAAQLIVSLFESLQKLGVSINLESCCRKEAIRVSGADITDVKIYDAPKGWEIEDV